MSTQALTGLRDFLVKSLSVFDMNWLIAELSEFIEKSCRQEPRSQAAQTE